MEWKTINNSLTKEFKLKDFSEVINLVNKIAQLAEKMDHHPDLLIHSYNELKVTIKTHSANKITDKDHLLAKAIDNCQ